MEEHYGSGSGGAERQALRDALALPISLARIREIISMAIGTILMIGVLLAAIIVLLLTLSPPPLYGPPEKNGSEVEPPDSQKRE